MHIVDSRLTPAMAPTSIKRFDKYKSIPNYRKYYDVASIYIIAKRPVPIVKILDNPAEVTSLFEIPEEISIKQTEDEKNTYAKSVERIKKQIDDGTIVVLEVSQKSSDCKIRGFYQLPDNISLKEFEDNLSDISFEEILFFASMGQGLFVTIDNAEPFVTYEVLYVGHCVGEVLTNRFKAHHALQKMLINEKTISKVYINSDEIVLIPFYLKSETISSFNGSESEDDLRKMLTNDFSFGMKEVNLDCEKALVHGMNPKYNAIRFKNYPKSKDGLYDGEAEVFCYSIEYSIILKYQEGMIYGAADSLYASRIIGDKREGTLTIYEPGEDYLRKYVERVIPKV